MAARVPVGQVYIRVSPDSTGFARDTRSELRKLKSLDNTEYKVDLRIDNEQAERELDRAITSLKAKALQKANHILFKSRLAWSAVDGKKEVKEQAAKYQALAETNKIDFRSNLEASDPAGGGPVTQTVNLDVDKGEFRRELDKVLADTRETLKIGVDQKSLKEEVQDSVKEFRTIFDMAFRRDKLKMDIGVSASGLRTVGEQLAAIQHNFVANQETVESTTRELQRVTREYRAIGNQITKIANEAERMEIDSIQAYNEQVNLLKQVEKLEQRRAVYAAERRRLIDIGRDAHVKVELDRESVVALEAEYEELQRSLETKTAEIGVGISEIDFRVVATRLANLARTRIALIVTAMTPATRRAVDGLEKIGVTNWGRIGNIIGGFAGRTTGIRLLYQTARDMLDIVPKLDMMIPKLAAVTTGAAVLISGAGTLLASMASIGADMLKVFQGVLLAPAGLAGLGLTVGLLARAWQDVDERLPRVVSHMKELGNIASASYWDTAADGIDGLYQALEPLLEVGIADFSEALGRATLGLANGLQRGALSHLGEFFDNSVEGFDAAITGLSKLGEAFMSLVGIGSRVFPDLGSWFTDIMTDFNTWVEENDRNGNIEKWIREAGQALQDISSIVYSAGAMFQDFADIVKEAGGPSLSDFASGMRTLRDIFDSPAFKGAAVKPLRAMFNFMKQMGNLKPQGLEALTTASDLFAESLNRLAAPVRFILGAILDGFNDPKFGEGWNQFVDGIGTFLVDIVPGVRRFTTELGGLFGIVGEGAKAFAPAFNELLLLVSNIGANIHPGLEDFLKFIGPELEELIKAVGPGLEDMATGISDILSNKGFQEFLSDVNDKLQIIVPAVEDFVNAILDLTDAIFDDYGELPDWMQDLISWGAAIGGISIAVGGLVTSILRPFRRVIPMITRGLASIFMGGGLAKVLRPILARFVGILAGPVGWLTLLASIIKPVGVLEFANGILEELGLDDSFFGRVMENIQTKVAELIGADGSLIDWVLKPLKDAWGGIKEGDWGPAIVAILGGTGWNLVKIIGESILEALGFENDYIGIGIASYQRAWAEDGIAGIFKQFWNSIRWAIAEGWNWLVSQLRRWKPAAVVIDFFEDPWGTISEWLGIGIGWFLGTPAWANFSWGVWAWTGVIRPWLMNGWTSLVSSVLGWIPFKPAIKFFQDPIGTALEWLGASIGWPMTAGFSLGNWGATLWSGTIYPWLASGWDSLVHSVMSWNPLKPVIEFFQNPIGTALKWLGIGEGWPATAVGEALDLGNWGTKIWTDTIKPWLDEGWGSLNASVSSWAPGGAKDAAASGGGGGGIIQRVLGLLDPDVAAVNGSLGNLGGALAAFGAKTRDEYGSTSTSVKLSTGQMRDGVKSDFTGMESTAATKTAQMRAKALVEFSTMAARGAAQMGKLQSAVSSQSASMSKKLTSNMVGMTGKAITQIGRLQRGLVSAMSSANRGVVAQGNSMQRAYISAMNGMAQGAIGVAGRIRGALPGILTINAGGAGRSTASTFVSGLSSGLSRAYSVARGIAGGVRSALSFSAFGSGATVGGTFASGIRSRIGAAISAANSLAAAVRNRMPRSPAKEGPFSGSGWGGWGESIAEELARGIRDTIPLVAREADNLASSVQGALDKRSNATLGIDFERTRSKYALSDEALAGTNGAPIVNVNVESTADDPLQDGRRLGNDITFALRGAGLA